MRRDVLTFALALAALCALLTSVRLTAGVDYARLSTVVHLPIVWAMTIAEMAIGVGCCGVAWQIARAYNGTTQSARTFPRLGRAVAFAFLALGASSIGDAVCHWLPAYWSLAAVKHVTAGVLVWAGVTWLRAVPEMREWFGHLLEAERAERGRR